MRASRLLSVLLLLQNRGRLTAEQLAVQLEVSVRTIYRDIEALSAAGVPVYADRGRAGGYQLLGGFRTRLTGLTETEAQALALSGLPTAAAELGLGTTLAAAQLKLSAALPPELRARADTVAQRFYLDVPGWLRDVERPEHLPSVADAVWHDRTVRVRYEKWDRQQVDRTLEPLGLVLKAGRWYLAARRDGRVATFRVGRIRALRVVGEFERGDDFDIAAFWARFSARFERRLYPRTALVRLSAFGRQLAPLYLGAVGARAVEAADSPVDDDGWQRLELPVEGGPPALGELLRFGPEIEVLEPPELRADVAAAAARMAAAYR
ncbi:MAG: helix-turn-helix transcriptional regulator [Thermocrispum sp.]